MRKSKESVEERMSGLIANGKITSKTETLMNLSLQQVISLGVHTHKELDRLMEGMEHQDNVQTGLEILETLKMRLNTSNELSESDSILAYMVTSVGLYYMEGCGEVGN